MTSFHYLLPDAASYTHGTNRIKEGKVGAIALAGGHGSRLGYNAPKGCFPISKIEKKSLYQLLAEKTLASSIRSGIPLQLGIMTSDATHKESVEHFEKANFFGLKEEQVAFFQQGNLPVLDEEGNPIMHLLAPDGNGGLFWHFAASGYLASWKKAGIEQIVVFPIDNALVDPFQPHLIGMHDQHLNDVTVIGIKRESASESVGCLVEQKGKLAVIEYSEMAESERSAVDATGNLKYPLANISYFCFSVSFIDRVLTHPLSSLPLHQAKKKIEEKLLYKSEYFIFDLLAFCNKAEVLVLPREDYFAPLKNGSGDASIEMVQKALEAHDRKRYHELTGKWPSTPFELSPLFSIQENL